MKITESLQLIGGCYNPIHYKIAILLYLLIALYIKNELNINEIETLIAMTKSDSELNNNRNKTQNRQANVKKMEFFINLYGIQKFCWLL